MGVAALTEHGAGRYDAAVVDLADGRRVVVRVATDDDAAAELTAEDRALHALTSGVRAQLPFRAPTPLGTAVLEGRPALITDHLAGYRVDAVHVPAGRGAAWSLGAALAAVHALPESVARNAGLPVRDAEQVRAEVSRLLDRVTSTHHGVPVSLLSRWSRALAADRLWRFETAVTCGGTGADAFLLEDVEGVPTVTGLLAWSGLGVGDPAADLHWLSSAPDAADDVFAAYLGSSARTPDDAVRTRARLYAELEFAQWLVHGHDSGRDDIVDDAVGLLTALAETVIDDDLLAEDGGDVDDAIALLAQTPATAVGAVDTSLQTDAYDAEDTAFAADDLSAVSAASTSADPLVGRVSSPDAPPADAPSADAFSGHAPTGGAGSGEDGEATAPIEGVDWVGSGTADAEEADRASQAALRRWAASS